MVFKIFKSAAKTVKACVLPAIDFIKPAMHGVKYLKYSLGDFCFETNHFFEGFWDPLWQKKGHYSSVKL